MSENNAEPMIEDLEVPAADGEQVVGGASVGPVHPLLPTVEGLIKDHLG